MQHQQKVGKNPIGKVIQEKKNLSTSKFSPIRPSTDFTFYGVTKTRSGHPENSIALKIITESGEQLLINYHEIISPTRCSPNFDKIKLSTLNLAISITGKNLADLLDYLAEHRVVWMKAPDSDFMKVEKEDEAEIESITIEEK